MDSHSCPYIFSLLDLFIYHTISRRGGIPSQNGLGGTSSIGVSSLDRSYMSQESTRFAIPVTESWYSPMPSVPNTPPTLLKLGFVSLLTWSWLHRPTRQHIWPTTVSQQESICYQFPSITGTKTWWAPFSAHLGQLPSWQVGIFLYFWEATPHLPLLGQLAYGHK